MVVVRGVPDKLFKETQKLSGFVSRMCLLYLQYRVCRTFPLLPGKCNSSRYLFKKHTSFSPASFRFCLYGSNRSMRLLYYKQFPNSSFLPDAYYCADWMRNIIYNITHAFEVFVIMFIHITILAVVPIINVSGQY